MNADWESLLTDFIATLREVDILLVSAESSVADEVKHATFNKSALLLLSCKFENFVELLVEQYVYAINTFRLPSDRIPEPLRLHHTFQVLGKIEQQRNSGQIDVVKQAFCDIATLWITSNPFDQLTVDNKFAYGKHGEKELIKLFRPIGINDVFAEIEVNVHDDTSENGADFKRVDFKGMFNSVMNMRNNILHQNATPSLTPGTIRDYKIAFECFSENIVAKLSASLQAFEGA